MTNEKIKKLNMIKKNKIESFKEVIIDAISVIKACKEGAGPATQEALNKIIIQYKRILKK